MSPVAPSERALRRTVVALLEGGSAHATLEQALDDMAPEQRGRRPSGVPYSIWEQIEHMRIAQEDILRYTLDAGWKSPPWPQGYWPEPREHVDDATWDRTISAFERDLEELIELVEDGATDLTAEVPHGEGRTYLRQALLVADHNAYHLGQIVVLRRALRAWKA